MPGTPYATEYTYDALDRVLTMEYPDGEMVTTTYNTQGLPITLTGEANYVHMATYDVAGRLDLLKINGGSQQTAYSYYPWTTANGQGRLQQITTGVTGDLTSLQNLAYTYDAVGNVKTIADYKVAGGTQTQSFGYDALDRLTSATATGGDSGQGQYSREYGYDDIGNLDWRKYEGVTVDYGYPASGSSSIRPHAVITTADGGDFQYDDNGNMTSRTENGVTYTQAWDAENRLVEVRTVTQTTAFVYDGDGSLVKKRDPKGTTYYVGSHYEFRQAPATPGATPVMTTAPPLEMGMYSYVATAGKGLYRSSDFTYGSGDPVWTHVGQEMGIGEFALDLSDPDGFQACRSGTSIYVRRPFYYEDDNWHEVLTATQAAELVNQSSVELKWVEINDYKPGHMYTMVARNSIWAGVWLLRSEDFGETWTAHAVKGSGWFYGIGGIWAGKQGGGYSDGTILYATLNSGAGGGARVYYSTNEGTSWSQKDYLSWSAWLPRVMVDPESQIVSYTGDGMNGPKLARATTVAGIYTQIDGDSQAGISIPMVGGPAGSLNSMVNTSGRHGMETCSPQTTVGPLG